MFYDDHAGRGNGDMQIILYAILLCPIPKGNVHLVAKKLDITANTLRLVDMTDIT